MIVLALWFSAAVLWCYLLNKRLSTPNPAATTFAAPRLSDDKLAALTYPTAGDMAEAMKAAGPPTGKAYIVVGGSGFVGRYIVRSLLGRGETLVRNIDMSPPDMSGDPSASDHMSRAEFIQADITNCGAIAAAISKPFGGLSSNVRAQVVIHTAAVIRHWERLPYLKHLCHDVNVGGTKNVLEAARKLGTVRAFVFTSSAAGFLPPAKYLRLWHQNPIVFGDDLAEGLPVPNSHYSTSKREADALVRASNDVDGMRTGVLRPGLEVIGPGDQYITVFCRNKGVNPAILASFLHTSVNPWDLARAHVQCADALETRPEEIAGKGFFITGQPTALSFTEAQRVIQFYSNRDLRFTPMPAILIYILSHVFEAIFLGRYYLLWGVSQFAGTEPAFVPRWATKSQAMLIQPSTWDLTFADYIINDDRARKLLGYRNLWTNEQTIKWTVETLQTPLG